MIALLLALLRLVARLRGRRFGEWIHTASGHRFWPLDPRPGDLRLVDIARGLANTCRYAGQLARQGAFYSVAEHCVLVSRAAGRLAAERGLSRADRKVCEQLAALHDAGEAYVADVASPVKRSWLLAGYRAAENHLLRVILRAHGLHRAPRRCWTIVHEADRRILVDEMDTLMRNADSRKYGARLGCTVVGFAPPVAERRFLQEYASLGLRGAL